MPADATATAIGIGHIARKHRPRPNSAPGDPTPSGWPRRRRCPGRWFRDSARAIRQARAQARRPRAKRPSSAARTARQAIAARMASLRRRAVIEQRADPGDSASPCPCTSPVSHGPLEAMAEGEASNRKRRRQPDQQRQACEPGGAASTSLEPCQRQRRSPSSSGRSALAVGSAGAVLRHQSSRSSP